MADGTLAGIKLLIALLSAFIESAFMVLRSFIMFTVSSSSSATLALNILAASCLANCMNLLKNGAIISKISLSIYLKEWRIISSFSQSSHNSPNAFQLKMH